MNVFEFTAMDTEELMKMTESELKSALSDIQGSVNRRAKRVSESGVRSQALDNFMSGGGKISVKGKNLNQLRKEASRAKRFLSAKTSTIKGSKSVTKAEAERLTGDSGITISEDSLKNLYETYDKVKNMIPEEIIKGTYGSGETQKKIYELMNDNPDATPEELADMFMNEYEEYMGEFNAPDDEDFDDSDEFDYF